MAMTLEPSLQPEHCSTLPCGKCFLSTFTSSDGKVHPMNGAPHDTLDIFPCEHVWKDVTCALTTM